MNWIVLIIIIILFILFMVFLTWRWTWYRKPSADKSKTQGFIFPTLKSLFWYLSCLSLGVMVPQVLKKYFRSKSLEWRYRFVDMYVVLWVVLLLVILFKLAQSVPTYKYVFSVIISYRLFEIFQSWFSQYVLGGVQGKWNPLNIHRNLILVFIGYIEVILSFAIFIVTFHEQFNFKNSGEPLTPSPQQALVYSLVNSFGNEVPIATSNLNWLSSVEVAFSLLFLTAAINRIFSHTGKIDYN